MKDQLELNFGMIEEFYNSIVLQLRNDEVYVMQLQARKKYHEGLTRDPVVIRKTIRRDDIQTFKDKIKQMWLYTDNNSRDYGKYDYLPPESFVLYFDICPKSTIKAYIQFMTEQNKKLVSKINYDDSIDLNFRRLDMNLYSAIVRSNSRKPYILIDVDKNDINIVKEIQEAIGKPFWVSSTHGGYHIIYKQYKKSPYWKIIHEQFADYIKSGDIEFKSTRACMTPITGTYQGGKMVSRVIL